MQPALENPRRPQWQRSFASPRQGARRRVARRGYEGRCSWWGSLTLLFALWYPSRVDAHALEATCTLKGSQVHVVAMYDDRTPARQARVRVYGAAKRLIADGRTDSSGRWSLPRPAAGAYEIQVDAGAGHRHTSTLHIPEAALPTDPAAAPAEAAHDTSAPRTGQQLPRLLLGIVIIAVGSGICMLMAAYRRRRAPVTKE